MVEMWRAECGIMRRALERRMRWIRSRSWRDAPAAASSSKLINLKLITRVLFAFILIIPVSALILSLFHSLSEPSLHTSRFSNAIVFNLMESTSLRQDQMARRSLLQDRVTPTGFPPPAVNGHVVVSQAPHYRSRRPFEYQSHNSPPTFQPPFQRFIHPPPIPP